MNIELDWASVGKTGERITKVVVPLAALALLLGIFIRAGRMAERWERSEVLLRELTQGENPALRKADLNVFVSQITTLSGQVEGYRSENMTTQAYVAALRLDLAKLGIKTRPAPWELQSVVIEGKKTRVTRNDGQEEEDQ